MHWPDIRRCLSGPLRRLASHRPLVLGMTLAIIISFTVCRFSSLLSVPEFALLDLWFRIRPPQSVDQRIALVGIEASVTAREQRLRHAGAFGKGCTCALLRRDELATLVQRLKQAGAAVTALDIIFIVECPLHDETLVRALQAPGQTVLLSRTTPSARAFNFGDIAFPQANKALIASPVLYNPRGIVRGIRLIQTDVESAAEASLSAPMVRPPFFLACYTALGGTPGELPEEQSDTLVRCADVDIPVLRAESVYLLGPLVHWRQQPSRHAMQISWAGDIDTFPIYSYQSVVTADAQTLRQWFGGKAVLVGAMSDQQWTPMDEQRRHRSAPFIDQSGLNTMTGIEVHANALNTVLQRHFIRQVPPLVIWLLIVATVTLTISVFRTLSAGTALAVTVVQMAIFAFAAHRLLFINYWLLNVTPAVAMVIGGLSGAIWGHAEARQRAARLETTLHARDVATTTLVHDLKQPLGAINILAQVLRTQQPGDGQPDPKVLQHIQQQVQLALGDIDELLATDPARQITIRPERFDLLALTRDLAVAQSLKTGIHKVEVRGPEEGVWVLADPRYIGRAVNNLMDNAIKYWPTGGTVIVEVSREKDQVVLRVIDQGLGINREAQKRLFQRFERVLPAGVDIPGTGIGLFSVRRIIEAHGGTIGVVSTPGEGSVFSITIPDVPAP